MKKYIALFALAAFLVGCTTTQQATTYNTIASIQSTAKAGYDAYIACVAKGQCATNGVPQVSDAYNKVQGGVIVAAALAQNSTNALAPAVLVQEATDLSNLIAQFQH